MGENEKARQFVVVMHGPSPVVFREGQSVHLTVHTDYGALNVACTSRWLKLPDQGVCPGHMWTEITGSAPALRDALDVFPQAGLLPSPIIAVSANAAVGHPQIELGFEVTPAVTERDYFQQYVLQERMGAVSTGRLIDLPATNVLMEHVGKSEHRDRLLRAMGQYQLALEHWVLGSSILAVAHLWMAVEALTKARIRVELARRKLVQEVELATDLGVEIKKLDATIRRQFIFQGDDDCYAKAVAASDGFEHGFSPTDKLQQLTAGVRDKTAEYVRGEILALSDIPADIRQRLLVDPFNVPQGPGILAKYLFGKLVGAGEQLAKEGNVYPVLLWSQTIKSCGVDGSGKINMEITDSITPQLADGIVLQPIRHEVWKP